MVSILDDEYIFNQNRNLLEKLHSGPINNLYDRPCNLCNWLLEDAKNLTIEINK